MNTNTGGSAFPDFKQTGITARDYFAAKALPGIVTAIMADECHNWKPADFAHEAYQIADAMIAERAK
jgi:hypothetical protein